MYAAAGTAGLQPLADGVKLLMKEDMIPKGADRVLFVLAPALVLGVSLFGAMAALPLAPGTSTSPTSSWAIFMILAMSSTTTIGVVMAGWASNSKWSLYGAMREAAQVVAYEIPLGICAACWCRSGRPGTFNLLDVSQRHAGGGLGMKWNIWPWVNPFVLPAFLLFFVAASLAETKRAPFDLPEAESELVAGFLTEYSGIRWSFFFMEEYAAMFLMSAVAAIFFFGGFESPFTALARDAFGEGSLLHLLTAHATLFAKALSPASS